MIRLAKPYIPESTFPEVQKILQSGNLVQGKYVQSFESSIIEYLGVSDVFMCSNGTAALHLALLALDIRSGDEVIVPAFTYPATVNVVELVGAKPVLVDIKSSDYCIDTDQIEYKITDKTKAIIPVHEFGQSANMDEILRIAKKYNLKIIEDAACALGTEYNNKKVGGLGDIGCFSLHPRKAITTGEGGIVVTSDKTLASKLNLLRNHGAQKVNGKLDFMLPGLNYRMTEFQAAIGHEQFKIIDKLIESRIKQAELYNELLKDKLEIKLPEIFTERKNVYQTYHILLNNLDRDDEIKRLAEKQIETNLGAQAIHCMSFYKDKYHFYPGDFPYAFQAYTKGLALPIGIHLNNEDIIRVVKELFNR